MAVGSPYGLVRPHRSLPPGRALRVEGEVWKPQAGGVKSAVHCPPATWGQGACIEVTWGSLPETECVRGPWFGWCCVKGRCVRPGCWQEAGSLTGSGEGFGMARYSLIQPRLSWSPQGELPAPAMSGKKQPDVSLFPSTLQPGPPVNHLRGDTVVQYMGGSLLHGQRRMKNALGVQGGDGWMDRVEDNH